MGDYIVHKAVELDKVKKSHRPTREELEQLFLIQPKYDGCNMVVVVRALDASQVEVLTRTGEKITSCAHIVDCLLKFPGITTGVYLGEAWHPKRGQNEISGAVRKNAPAEWLQFVVFDYLTVEEFDAGRSDLGYLERTKRIPEPFFRINVRDDTPVWPAVCEGTLAEIGIDANEAAKQYVALGGYDGIIARNPLGKWERGSGTTGETIKFKPLLSFDLRVVDYEPGKGKHEGRIGSLIVEFRGKRMGAGTGLKDRERDVARFEHDWLGKIVEVEAMGYSADGLLREPRLKGVRTDVLEPDA